MVWLHIVCLCVFVTPQLIQELDNTIKTLEQDKSVRCDSRATTTSR